MDEGKRDDILDDNGEKNNSDSLEAVAEDAGDVFADVKNESDGQAIDTADTSVKKLVAKDTTEKTKPAEKRGGQNQENKQGKLSVWFKDIKAEFNKIIWPNKKELGKMTVTVIVTSLLFGLLITGLDIVFNSGVGLLIDLFKASA